MFKLWPILVYDGDKAKGQITQINLAQIVSLSKIGNNYYVSMTGPVVAYGHQTVHISKPSYDLLVGLSEKGIDKPTTSEIEVELLNMGTNNG